MISLILAGIFTGTLSGFFGIGGGTILVPFLIFLGFAIKDAIGISLLQMLMASIFGSYLNSKNGLIDLKLIIPIGVGGFLGAIGSPFFMDIVSDKFLEVIFLIFLIYAFYRVYLSFHTSKIKDLNFKFTPPNRYILILIGTIIGFFAISIGVGGSLLLVPILVGFFHYEIKKAIATGLFFVIFSSFSGVIGFALAGKILYYEGFLIGISSLIGVLIGIKIGKLTDDKTQKIALLTFYGAVLFYLAYRVLGKIEYNFFATI